MMSWVVRKLPLADVWTMGIGKKVETSLWSRVKEMAWSDFMEAGIGLLCI